MTELGAADIDDRLLEDWDFNRDVLHELEGDDPESCTEFAVRCENGSLITRFMRGKFTVSDTPCAGLGGGSGGGPGGGSGGGPGGGGGTIPPPGPTPEWHWCWGPTGWYQLPIDVPCPDGGTGSGGGGGGTICPPGTYWGFSVSYGGWACIPFGDSSGGGAGAGWRTFAGGGVLGGASATLGGPATLDPFPRGTSPQVLGFDSSGNLTATTISSSPGTVSPAALSANQNDYNPGAAGILRLQTDTGGDRTITGLGIGQTDGQRLVLYNIGAVDNILLAIASGSSSAANRWANGTAVGNITIAPGTKREFVYSNSLWEMLY